MGIQIGVLSTLAPGQAAAVSEVAISALISGIVATLTSACIAGMLIIDEGTH
jgi:CNT family concentrative nucleoside transporter